jgi:long-chain acyl-CoA synthetase
MNSATMTIPSLMLASADRASRPVAFRFKHNGDWVNVSSDEFAQHVQEMFHGLLALGCRPESRVAIISENRIEWAITDYAAQIAGAIVVPVYPTLSPAQMETVLTDCAPSLIFTSSLQLLEKVIGMRKRLRSLKFLIAFDPKVYQPGVLRVETLYKTGRQSASEHPDAFRAAVAARKPDDIATIIYTSGTTGMAKGAILTHRNLVSNILATQQVLPMNSDDVELSFLPLSHIFQRHVDYAAFHAGVTIAYASDLAAVADDLPVVRPTFIAGVPRFFEKVRAKILTEVQRQTITRRTAFDWAFKHGVRAFRSGRRGAAFALADRLVFRKIKERLGGRLKWCASAGAPLEKEVAEFFFAIGVPVLEGYGLTETSPVVTLTPPDQVRLGSVGKPVGDVEIRIAADGEILVRGSSVTQGYWGKPRETEEAFGDGWFHTGDIGRLSPDGYLEITDRKKDLIITSTGRNVAPQRIESRLKLIPYFENIVVVGDRRSFLSALIVPNMDAMLAWARSQSIAFNDPVDLLARKEIHDLALREIEKKTTDLSDFERIRKIAFLENGFSVDSGELTPTLKLRRSIIENKFRDRINQLYAA